MNVTSNAVKVIRRAKTWYCVTLMGNTTGSPSAFQSHCTDGGVHKLSGAIAGYWLHPSFVYGGKGWRVKFYQKANRTNRPCKQRPMKLIWLVSLVFVKVHMARDLAVLVMSSGESRTKSKTSWRNDATNSLILGMVKIFSRSSTVYDQQMTKEFLLSCVAL